MLEPRVRFSGVSGRERFAEFGAAFASGAHFGAGFQSEPRIARAIAVDAGAYPVEVLALVAARGDFGDAAVLHDRGVDGGFEQQRDIGLADDLVVKQQVPEFPAALRIVDGVGEAQLLDQAALAPAGTPGVLIGADHVHLHFARGIAAEARAVLHQDDARSVARRGDRGTDTRESSACDQDVGLQAHFAHMRLGCGEGGVGRRDFIEIAGRARERLRLGIAGEDDQGVGAESQVIEKIAAVHAFDCNAGVRSGARVPESAAIRTAHRNGRLRLFPTKLLCSPWHVRAANRGCIRLSSGYRREVPAMRVEFAAAGGRRPNGAQAALHADRSLTLAALIGLAMCGVRVKWTVFRSERTPRGELPATPRKSVLQSFAERQIDAAGAGERVVAGFQRGDAMVGEPRFAAPDHHVAALQSHAARPVLARRAAELKDCGQPERDRDDGRGVVLLVAVLVQGEARAGLVTIDQAGVASEVGKARFGSRRRWPGPGRTPASPAKAVRSAGRRDRSDSPCGPTPSRRARN